MSGLRETLTEICEEIIDQNNKPFEESEEESAIIYLIMYA